MPQHKQKLTDGMVADEGGGGGGGAARINEWVDRNLII